MCSLIFVPTSVLEEIRNKTQHVFRILKIKSRQIITPSVITQILTPPLPMLLHIDLIAYSNLDAVRHN